jgi:hypothetical protein
MDNYKVQSLRQQRDNDGQKAAHIDGHLDSVLILMASRDDKYGTIAVIQVFNKYMKI